jgi:membrane-bound serine protease (ClpP class)
VALGLLLTGLAGAAAARCVPTDLLPGRDAGPAPARPDGGVDAAAPVTATPTASATGLPAAKAAPAPLPRRNVDPRKTVAGARRILRVPLSGTIELGLQAFLRRVLADAGPRDVVVLDIDTFGGRVDAATQIRDALLRTRAKTVAYVNPRAISAGALISLACDLIVMAPGGSIGAATPVQMGSGGEAKPTSEKVVSYMRKEMKTTAEAKGRRGDLAEKMVDPALDVTRVPEALKESVSGLKAGKLLTLTTDEAMALDLVEAKVKDWDDLVAQLGLQGVKVVRPRVNWAEAIARFLTDPVVSSLLMTLGILGLLIELYTPGIGLPGAVGLLCLILFFTGHKVAGLAGWEPLMVFAVGAVLLAVEIFVTPGFGVLGIGGIVLIVGSLVWALVGSTVPLSVSWDAGYVSAALTRVAATVVIVAVLGGVLAKVMPHGGPFRRLVLEARIDGRANAGADRLPAATAARGDLLGRTGVAETALRPAGRVRIDDGRVEAEAEGELIAVGTAVRVVRVEADRVIVQKVPS